jgi:hypothetical protein
MDALSHVLESVRLEGAVFLNAEFAAPWCIRGRFGLARAKARLPTADHVVFFHVLVHGQCRVRLVDDAGGTASEVAVHAGDVILLSRDDRYLMGSDLQLAPLETEVPELAAAAQEPDFVLMRHGGSGDATRFVCGYLGCSRAVSRPLIAALPRMACVSIGDGQAMGLLRELLRVGVRESLEPRPGTEPMLSRLAELIFVEALRRYAQSLPPEGKGWLAATRDVQNRTGARVDPRGAGSCLERRRACQPSGAVAIGARGPLHLAGRRAADPVPDALAPRAGRAGLALRSGVDRPDCRAQRL